MARKKAHPEHENHERWLVSYADFITLLFAFFVVMYSISSVNDGKFRVLSESLVASFRSSSKSLAPIQIGQPMRSPYQFSATTQNIPFTTTRAPIELSRLKSMQEDAIHLTENGDEDKLSADGEGDSFAGNAGEMETISEDVEQALGPLLDDGMISLRKNKNWLEIEINSSILFSSGSSALARDGEAVLKSLANVLKNLPNRINVEGFTDNLPIKNEVYPSNWELSAGRAATVVRLFASYGVDPVRLVSIGYGEFRPVADNATAAGRSANRRVSVVILATTTLGAEDGDLMRQLDDRSGATSPLELPDLKLANVINIARITNGEQNANGTGAW